MAIAVRKTYACPTCGESFTKWGLCQSHVRASAPCREALGEKARDPDALQELCRVSAGGGAAVETGNGLSPLSPGSGAAAGPPGLPTAAATLPTCPAPGLQAPPALEGNQDSLYAGEPVRQLSAHVKKRFRRAVTTGCLTEADLQELEAKYEELADHPAAVQLAAVDKFMRLGFEKLSRVTNKGAWLQCCLSFCVRTNLVDPPLGSSKPSAALVDALASQALLPDALSQDCWDQYAALTPELQYCVASAVRGSVLINAEGRLSEHFFHVASNERAIYRLEDAPAPRVEQLPQQVPWEALDGGLYHRLLQKMFFRQKVAPEQVLLRELNEVDGSVAPGDPGSLLYVHLATQQARLQGSAEVLSILHAAAASGLVRICARFIAEGLDVNERTGCQGFTPLHLASTSGEVEVVKLLLRQRADPNARDGDGHSALYGAVAKAVQLQKSEEGRDVAAATQECEQQAKVCMQLLLAGAENTPESNFVNDEEPQSAESLAQANGLTGILRIIWLHGLLKSFKQKFDVSEVAILELCELQFETARFVINMFEKHVSLSPEAAPTEFRALISSDFIKSRDKVQRYGNRLARRMELSKKAVDILADLPPAAGLHALSTWKIEEVVDHVYAVPDHLNAAKPAQEGAPAGTLDNSTEGTDGNSSIAKGAEGTKNGFTNGSSRHGRNEEPKLTGRIRKWDSERGFGFVVQDPREGEEHPKDVFVHRKNIVGSTPQNHIDLRENSRISYRLGEQDGRPRAHDVTTIDPDGYPLPIHFQSGDDSVVGLRDDALDGFDNEDDCDEERLTRMFMRHLRSKEVQDMARERRPECEAYLRCVGLRRHHAGRRDDSMWKREIEHRVDIFLERCTAPLHKRDFDFRVRRFLHEFSVHSGSVTRVSEALAMVETSTRGKRRDEVQNWPAYLATLLRRWDPKLYEVLAERDRRSRVEQKKAREANDSTMGESTLGVDASVLDGSEPGGGVAGGRSGHSSDESDHEDKRSGSDDDGVDTRRSSRSRGSSVGSRRSVSEGNAASSTDSDFDRQNAPPPPPKGPPPPPPMGPPPPPPVQRNGGAGPGGGRAPGLFAAAMKAAGAVAGGSSMGGGPLARKTFQ